MNKLKRVIKGAALALVLFMISSLLGAVLLKFTAFPENWGFFYVLGCLSLCCFVLAYYLGIFWQKGGLFCGFFSGAGMVLLILSLTCSFFGRYVTFDILTPFYLIPIAFGILGGILGANVKK